MSKPEFARRGSVSSEKQWGSFGGFQWEGPSIFEEEMIAAPRTPLPPNIPDHQFYDPTAILSVPMLPSVSLEPIYRQQRSFSFSMGQDPTFFGYDDYSNNRLAPTMEEEEEDQFDDAYLRARSQSSNATFGGFWSNNRRSSLGFIPSSPFIPAENHKDILSQRRMSQPLNNVAEYSFPEIIPNGGPSK